MSAKSAFLRFALKRAIAGIRTRLTVVTVIPKLRLAGALLNNRITFASLYVFLLSSEASSVKWFQIGCVFRLNQCLPKLVIPFGR